MTGKTMITSIQMLIAESRKMIKGKVNMSLSEEEMKCLLSYYNSLEKPEIVLCNSFDKHSNLLHWREKWYVVYDRHFSQLLKDLNRIFFFEENEIDAYKIIAQIYAEELFLKGKFVKSGQSINSFFKKDKKKYCMNPEFEEVLKIQEAFIISHELAHWFYFRIQEKEKVSRALDMHYEKCRGYFDEVEREKTVQAADDKIIKLVFHYFKVNPGIQEESYCDISAITFLLAHFKVLSNLNSIEAASAAFLALYAMQLTGFIKYSVNAYYTDHLEKEIDTEVMDLEIMLRVIIFLKYLEEYFDRFEKEQADEYKRNQTVWMYKSHNLFKDKLNYVGDLLFSSDDTESNKEYDIFSREWEDEYRKIEKILSGQ